MYYNIRLFTLIKDKTDCILENVRFYIAWYPVLGTVQSTLHFTPGRPVHSNAISTSL